MKIGSCPHVTDEIRFRSLKPLVCPDCVAEAMAPWIQAIGQIHAHAAPEHIVLADQPLEMAVQICQAVDKLKEEIARLAKLIEDMGWAGGMVLGICEGAPNWENVVEKENSYGLPMIRAAKELRRYGESKAGLQEKLNSIKMMASGAGPAWGCKCHTCEMARSLP